MVQKHFENSKVHFFLDHPNTHLISTSVWRYLVPSPWAHGRFVACNEHVHPLSLTSSSLLYMTIYYILIAKIRVVPTSPFF